MKFFQEKKLKHRFPKLHEQGRSGAGWGRWAYIVKCRSSLNTVICRQFCILTLKASVFLFLMHETFWFGFTKVVIRVIKAKLVINATSLSCSLIYIYIYIYIYISLIYHWLVYKVNLVYLVLLSIITQLKNYRLTLFRWRVKTKQYP